MADSLVTQVSQEQDPAKLAEIAKQQAEQIKKQKQQQQKEQEAAQSQSQSQSQSSSKSQPDKDKTTTKATADTTDHDHSTCCWRFFCCCLGRKKESSTPSPTTTPTQQESTHSQEKKPTEISSSTESPSTPFLMAPQAPECKGQKTLVLDLDETLVHSSFRPVPGPDFVITINLDGVSHRVYVQKRPGVDEFLEQCASKFEVVVFTASLDKYANPLLDILDPKGFVRFRLFREACVQHYGNYVKDLSLLGRRLQDTLIIDNSPFSYMFQPDNAIPCTSWFNDKTDRELYDLVPFLLEHIAPCEDVARVIVERKQMAAAAGEE